MVLSRLSSPCAEGRSDVDLYYALPEIFKGQFWAGHVTHSHPHLNPDDYPGPDDVVDSRRASPTSATTSLRKSTTRPSSNVEDNRPPDADLMKEIDKMNDTAPK
jgi:hypothetical protein